MKASGWIGSYRTKQFKSIIFGYYNRATYSSKRASNLSMPFSDSDQKDAPRLPVKKEVQYIVGEIDGKVTVIGRIQIGISHFQDTYISFQALSSGLNARENIPELDHAFGS